MTAPRLSKLLITLLLLALTPEVAAAQYTAVAGVVRDSSGGALPGVTVEASSPALIEGTRRVVTDRQGLYQIVDLRPGTYVVTFTLPGFNALRREAIDVSAGTTVTLNVELELGRLEETVVVSTEMPVVDTRSAAQQRVLHERIRDALPSARSMHVMGSLVPGMVMTGANAPTGQDVGGLSGERGQMMIHGSRGGDMSIQLEGMEFNSNQNVGAQQYYTLNPAEAEEFQYTVAAISAETLTGGVRANAVTKSGGNRFSGTFFSAYTTGAWQSNNLTEDLQARGLQSANPIEQIYDYNASFGGPIVRDRLWFFGSTRWMRQREQVAGMYRPIDPLSFTFNPALGAEGNADLNRPAVFDSWGESYGLRLTWQAHPRHRISAYVAFQPNGQTPQFMSGTRSFEAASLRESPLTRMIQASWRTPITDRFFFEASFMGFDNTFTQTPTAAWITEDVVSVIDTGTGMQFRSSPRYYAARFHQPLLKFSGTYVTGSHALKFGFDTQWGYTQFGPNTRNLGMRYSLNNGDPRQIQLIMSPYTTQENFYWYAFYAQEQWTIRRLTLNAGVRFDYQNQSVPEQTSGPGPNTPPQVWPAIPDLVGWRDISPRLGGAFDLFGNSRTAIKASLSRYPVRDLTGFAADNNPLSFNLSANRAWTDANRDMIPQENELGPLSNADFGTGATTRTVDQALAHGWHVRPLNWEVTAGIQHALLPQLSVDIAYVRRAYGNFSVTDNLLVGPDDYTEFCIVAPDDDRLPGAGEMICGLYDLNPDKRGLVQNFVTGAHHYGKQTETFNGVDVGVNLRLPWLHLSGGLASGTSNNSGNSLRNSTSACFVVDSPQLRHCRIDIPWRTQVKVLGSVELPWDVNVGATFQSVPGSEITASYNVNSSQVIGLGRPLSGGSFTVPLIQPGAVFGDRILQVDVRLAKALRYRNTNVQFMLDVANLTNASPVLLQNNTYGSNWLRPTYILPGRIVKPSVRVSF